MESISKRVLYLAMGFALTAYSMANAGTLQVTKYSQPITVMNKVSQPINLSFVADGNWKILVEPLDSQIRNLDNPSYTLPINRLELAEMNGTPIANFNYGSVLEVKNSNIPGVNNLNLALNMLRSDADYPGNYVTDVKFSLYNNNNLIAEDVYSLRYTQEDIASVEFSRRMMSMKIDKDKVLQKNSKQNLPAPFGLYVSSNRNWKLYVRNLTNDPDKSLKYFMKVMGGGDDTITLNQSEYIPITSVPIMIASGKSTINQMMNNLEKKIINIDYMVQGPENTFIPAGSKTEEFEYRLETEK